MTPLSKISDIQQRTKEIRKLLLLRRELMKQVLQNLKTGTITVTDVPPPIVRPGFIQVRTAATLISAGTERMTVEMGQKSLLGKARERPDLVKQVIQKAKQEGIANTVAAVRSRLGSLNALGYSAAGIVSAVGENVSHFQVGDRVACAGAGFASHAEVLVVPRNLCARVPEAVSFDAAAFTTLGAIALQGVRLAEITLGESVVVIGLGLIGQVVVQLLKAHGCRVFGIDLNEERIALARNLGADEGGQPNEEVKRMVMDWSRGRGADAVLIAAATSSNQPIELAGEISRQKGRVVAIGAIGMNIPRKPYYERELTFKISMSYGPGRYDPQYEERGHDYPVSHVRWTEGRNLEAFLDQLAAGRVKVEPLISHRFPIEQAEAAYQLITGESKQPYLGVLLQYETERPVADRVRVSATEARSAAPIRVGLIGAGNYAKTMILPNLKLSGAEFHSVATAMGVTARTVAEKFGFTYCVANADEIINSKEVNLVVVATRHDSHAEFASRALRNGHHVFVEKPLALNEAELNTVIDAANNAEGQLMVGFNRRFSPLAVMAKQFFQDRHTPLSINYRINAGRIPLTHWIQDPHEGGGRIIGEVCHFIDLAHFLTGSLTTRLYAESISSNNQEVVDEDSVFITLRLRDGSNCSIAYLAEGDRALPKERIEIFGGGKSFVINDFRTGAAYHRGRESVKRLREQDKGQKEQLRIVCEVVLGKSDAPITLADLATTTRVTFGIRESLRTAGVVHIPFPG